MTNLISQRLAGALAIGLLAAATGVAGPAYGTGSHTAGLAGALRKDIQAYLEASRDIEHVSAAALSLNLPGRRSTIDVSAGTMRFGGRQPVSTSSVWQVGSNTKAFTSVLLLKLEAEHRLSIGDTLGRWLPQYPQWHDVTIRRLLNMTSGIPSYDDQPEFYADVVAQPYQYFSPQRLVGYVIGARPTSKYSYSNTNYVLAEMIIEKVTGDNYQHQLYSRIIEPLQLHNLFYRPDFYPRRVTAREPAGYYAAAQPAELTGRDVSRYSLSSTRGAGGIISTTHDLTVWERALYGGALLPPRQQAELTSLISQTSGEPIDRTTVDDPKGFALGLDQATNPKFGTFWFYEGGTLGFRVLHLYFPDSGIIVAVGLNSYRLPAEDGMAVLAQALYDTLVAYGLHPARK